MFIETIIMITFQLVHEVGHQVAAYRQLVQSLGTQVDGVPNRRDLESARKQCLKLCDNTKNSMLPQLKRYTLYFFLL